MDQNEEKYFYQELKDLITGKMKEGKNQDLNYRNIEEDIYNKIKEITMAKLRLKKSNELLFKNFNLLTKEELSEFGISKKYSNRESYFYLLEYFISVEIIEEEQKMEIENDENFNNIITQTLSLIISKSDNVIKNSDMNNNEKFIYIGDEEEIFKQNDFIKNDECKEENFILLNNIEDENNSCEKNIMKNFEFRKENFIPIDDNNKNNKNREYKLLIDISTEKIIISKNPKFNFENFISIESNIEETEKKYAEMIMKKNIDIKEIFKLKEKITLKSLKEKLNMFLNVLTYNDEPPIFYPKFESELYYHYQLRNILQSIKELKTDEKLKKKINMIKGLYEFIPYVKNHKIRDKIILTYFYLVMDVEYDLPIFMFIRIRDYIRRKNKYNNAKVDESNNKLIITKKKIINDFDCYQLDESDIKKIKNGLLSLPLDSLYYSLKGLITFREINKEYGNLFYDKFIGSKLFCDIFDLLYDKKYPSLNFNFLRELFKNNTYYFPIKNYAYRGYCDKNNFKIFINNPPSEEKIYFDEKMISFIKKSFMIVNSEHQLGHALEVILFIIEKNNNNEITFDSPLIKIKLISGKVIKTKKGGKIFEYLLYNKIIQKLNLKQVIYICNLNNFSKSLKQFRIDFLKLKNQTLYEVFKKESENNNEFLEIYKLYNNLPKKTKDKLEKIYFTQYELETISSLIKRRKRDKKRIDESEEESEEESESDNDSYIDSENESIN